MGVEPTAFPGLSRDGLPVAYLADSILGGIRTHDLHRERMAATTPGPLGHESWSQESGDRGQKANYECAIAFLGLLTPDP